MSALALRRVGEAVEPGITTAELDAIAEGHPRRGRHSRLQGLRRLPRLHLRLGERCRRARHSLEEARPARGGHHPPSTPAPSWTAGWATTPGRTRWEGGARGAAPAEVGSAACGRDSTRVPPSASAISGTRCSRWPRRPATRWCATMWATASAADARGSERPELRASSHRVEASAGHGARHRAHGECEALAR